MLSIVIPAFNESENLAELITRIREVLGDKYEYEILIVDDGSTDSTREQSRLLCTLAPRVKFLFLSRNYGHQSALLAGLAEADGDCVITMDADLQHPPEFIIDLVETWKKGYEVVLAAREDKSEMTIKSFSSRLYYRIFGIMSGIDITANAADFRLLDRRVVNIIINSDEHDLFLRAYVEWIGFKKAVIRYSEEKRHKGQTKYSIKKMIELASNGLVSFSVKPLRMILVFGVAICILTWVYLVYVLISLFTGSHIEPGWSSLIVAVLFTSGLQMVFIGIIGEYIGRIFVQVKGRPNYILEKIIVGNEDE